MINIARWFVGRSMVEILIRRRLWLQLIATQPHPEYCWNYECRPLCGTRSTVDYRQSKPSSTRSILSNFAISIWLSHGSSQVIKHQWTEKRMTKTERFFHPIKTVLIFSLHNISKTIDMLSTIVCSQGQSRGGSIWWMIPKGGDQCTDQQSHFLFSHSRSRLLAVHINMV